MIDKKQHDSKPVIHPAAAAAMGAVVGAAGGIAAAKYLSDPDNQKMVGEKFNKIKQEAKKRWDELGNQNNAKALKDKANDLIDEGKRTMRTSSKAVD